MALLCDHAWKTKYTPDDGDLVDQFYVQALDSAARYDRTTGFFAAGALTLAARGIQGLVRNNGRMRLLIGCTLDEPETTAIRKGESLRDAAGAAMLRMPLLAPGATEAEALELLAWMVAKGFLDVKVAVPCDAKRRPIAGLALFHEKAGVIEDKTGDRVAFAGSINETAQGWKHNWESFHVFCSWSGGEQHVAAEEESFARLWSDKSPRALVIDVPTAVRDELLKFLPEHDRLPARLEQVPDVAATAAMDAQRAASASNELRDAVWTLIWNAPTQPSGVRIGEATSAVTPWPHQVRAFERMWEQWPPKLLIADEVGLGKTIEAGLLLRQAWLSGRAKRILVLAPKAVLTQWQRELREKFNLDWPIYDGDALIWQPTPVHPDGIERPVARDAWQREPFLLVSSQLMRRRERQQELLGDSVAPWDIVVLDEAHHARRRNPGQPGEGGPNLLLRLMQGLRRKTQALLLLSATPMQVHPLEVFDLLALLDLPPEWTASSFQEFFRLAAKPDPTPDEFDRLAQLFQS
ncbi:MAG: SNF2-related protein, partial [Casimicrobiaceae bacterium]